MKHATVLWCLLLSLAGAIPAVAAGAIRGTVSLPHGASERVSRSRMIETVLYLDPVPDRLEMKLARKAKADVWVAIRHGHFVPAVRVVALGTVVHYVNRDRGFHNVFSVSPVRRFDLGKLAPGESRFESFDRTGPVQVFCELHPNETGHLLVVPNHVFVHPDARGGFSFPKLPPGTYALRMWHPEYGEQARTVEIPKRGDLTLSLHF